MKAARMVTNVMRYYKSEKVRLSLKIRSSGIQHRKC
jgi:hypothetical protein